MERSTKVYVRICGKGFNIVSDERPEYMTEVAQDVDERMDALLRGNSRITYDMAAVLTALNLCDELKQEKLLNRMTVDKTKTEALEKKLAAAEESIAELKKQNAQQLEEHKKAMEKIKLEWAVREKEFMDMIDEIGDET